MLLVNSTLHITRRHRRHRSTFRCRFVYRYPRLRSLTTGDGADSRRLSSVAAEEPVNREIGLLMMKTDIYRAFTLPTRLLFGSLFISGSQHTGLTSVRSHRSPRTLLEVLAPKQARAVTSVDGHSTGMERAVSLVIIDFHACVLIEPRFAGEFVFRPAAVPGDSEV